MKNDAFKRIFGGLAIGFVFALLLTFYFFSRNPYHMPLSDRDRMNGMMGNFS